jgi:4-hydroxy-3-methylbut-2-enyl diphosphate reductase
VKVEVIKPHGLCAGVNAAVAKALALKDVYCLNELVHNEIVVDELKALGYRFVKSIEEVPEGESVVFSAHGVSPQVRKLAKERSLKVIDTTCPFVAKVHQAVKAFAKNGLLTKIFAFSRLMRMGCLTAFIFLSSLLFMPMPEWY